MTLPPGLYRKPVEPQRAVRQLMRADIPVFIGYATRGPLGQPVRIRTLSQFEEIFAGGPGYLWHGVKGFFENGGDALYVLRLASGTATAAQVVQDNPAPVSWRAQASFAWPLVDPRRLSGHTLPGAQPWVALYEDIVRQTGPRSADPGAWGNLLQLVVRQSALAQTETVPGVLLDEGHSVMLADLSGLEGGSVLQLSQRRDGATISTNVIPAALDSARQMLRFAQPVSALAPQGFDPDQPIRIESIEFDFEVIEAGRIVQSLTGLSPNPSHSRAIADVFGAECKSLGFAPVSQRAVPVVIDGAASTQWQVQSDAISAATLPATDWSDPSTWPRTGQYQLSGGSDGLHDLEIADYEGALRTLQRVPEAALIAAPDLVVQPPQIDMGDTSTPYVVDCTDLTPPPENYLNGKVTGLDADGAEQALAGVSVDPAGLGKTARSDAEGSFSLSGLSEGLITLRLSKAGYEDLEYQAQSSPFATAEPVTIAMSPLTAPKVFSRDTIQMVQMMMANPAVAGPYKVAVLDVPAPSDRLPELLTWRARLGDLPRAALAGPWLRLPEPDGALINAPASCHLCGLLAQAEAREGVHRSGANIQLRHCEGSTLALNDTEHGVLNDAQLTAMIVRPGRGIRAGGARSLAADPSLMFISTRRILDTLERTLEQVLQPMVFEPNNIFTRQAVTMTARSLLERMWRIGMLTGSAPEQAFTVKCDLENNPDESRAAGRLVVDIGVAPTIPLEFIWFRLGHARDITKVTEGAT